MSFLSPRLLGTGFAIAREDPSSILFGHRGRDANAESHLLLITKNQGFGSRLENPLPDQQTTRIDPGQSVGLLKVPDRFSLRIDQLILRAKADAIGLEGRFGQEPSVPDPSLVPPEVMAVDISESEPNSAVHVGMVIWIDSWNRRVIAGHLGAAKCSDIGKKWTQALVILIMENGQCNSSMLEYQLAGLRLDRPRARGWFGRVRSLLGDAHATA